jgi:hypothetical protein
MEAIPFPSDQCPDPSAPDFGLRYRGEYFQCHRQVVFALSGRIAEETLADPLLTSFTIPDSFPSAEPVELMALFLSGEPLELPPDANLLSYFTLSLYLKIAHLIDSLSEPILSSCSQPDFFDYLTFAFESHSEVSLLLESLLSNTPPAELLENPRFRELDSGLLDMFFSQCSSSDQEPFVGFMLEKGGRLLRHIDLRRVKPDVVTGLLENPDVNLNWLTTPLVNYFGSKAPG